MSNSSISFGGTEVARHRHICTFFRRPEDKYRALLPFIRDGLLQGDKVVMVVDPRLRDRHLTNLDIANIDVATVLRTGQLEVRDWDAVYLQDGHFDRDRMLALVRDVLTVCSQRYPSVRVIGNMEWVFEDGAGTMQDLLEYESQINEMVPDFRVSGICTYDLSRFRATDIMDILRTHPVVMLDNIVQANPYFVPPGEFLRDLRNGEDSQHPKMA
jgi:hypothetical protein